MESCCFGLDSGERVNRDSQVIREHMLCLLKGIFTLGSNVASSSLRVWNSLLLLKILPKCQIAQSKQMCQA